MPAELGFTGPSVAAEPDARAARLHLRMTPNPAPGPARIGFTLVVRAHVCITVFDALGRMIRTLRDAPHDAGPHELAWDAATLRPGVYLVRLHTGNSVVTRPLVVAR